MTVSQYYYRIIDAMQGIKIRQVLIIQDDIRKLLGERHQNTMQKMIVDKFPKSVFRMPLSRNTSGVKYHTFPPQNILHILQLYNQQQIPIKLTSLNPFRRYYKRDAKKIYDGIRRVQGFTIKHISRYFYYVLQLGVRCGQ